MKYLHLYRNKWLCIKPEKIKPWYFPHELDKDDIPLKELRRAGEISDFEHLEIILSEENPNVVNAN